MQFSGLRRVYSCTVLGDNIVVVGGRGGDYDTCRCTDTYNILTGRWDRDGLVTQKSVAQDFLDRFNRNSFIGGAVVVQSTAPRFWTHKNRRITS